MLADLINFATEGATAARWTLANMDLHRRSADAVQVQKNKTLQIYPVDPIFPGDWESWLQNHQQMHVNNPSISLRDFHLHTNLSKIPPFNITNIIDRPMFFLFKSNSIIQDFVLLFISFMIILLFLLLVLVLYRRYTKSLLANEISF